MKFIFKVRVKDGHSAEEYIAAWKKGSAIIQKEPGAHGTVLHRKLDEPNTLLAVAEWDSKEARDAAMEKLDQEPPEIQKILKAHRELGDIEPLGNFEEIRKVEPYGTQDH